LCLARFARRNETSAGEQVRRVNERGPSVAGTNTLNTIADLDEGNFVVHLDEALRSVVKAVSDTSQKGSLSVQIFVEPDGRAVKIWAKYAAKMPAPPTTESRYFVTKEGDLTVNDPKQLELKDVKAPVGKPRLVDTANTPPRRTSDENKEGA
jgi:hypothetical protein